MSTPDNALVDLIAAISAQAGKWETRALDAEAGQQRAIERAERLRQLEDAAREYAAADYAITAAGPDGDLQAVLGQVRAARHALLAAVAALPPRSET